MDALEAKIEKIVDDIKELKEKIKKLEKKTDFMTYSIGNDKK